ncbi:unnamed protein product [Dictyota dichotoma]|uniref:Ribosomal protein S11 n=1 Tax=Dictyota dichotoma TaxID=2876 RepID=Q2TUB4_DICDH|nr:ribosomal protein S11 [Dictyota dichotoma]AAS79081.1 ribosomal protein S11 [Dictyota dichotoma]
MLSIIKKGLICVRTTKRNVLISLIDINEKKVKLSSSLGCLKGTGFDKRANYASVRAFSEIFTRKIQELGYTDVSLMLRGLGVSRVALIHVIRDYNLKLNRITDETLSSHNGCRPSKQRRKKIRTRISFKTKKLLSPGS